MILLVSDPLHSGHIEYLRRAKKLGEQLIVIVNNDHQTEGKKGFVVMTCRERIEILRNLEFVDFAVESIDGDGSVCKTLQMLHPHIFANGGDQTNESIPESVVCQAYNIELADGLGSKIQSSRWLVRKLIDSTLENSASDSYLNDKTKGPPAVCTGLTPADNKIP